MAKKIIPHKLVVSFDETGKFAQALLMYQIKENTGNLLQKYHTISVDSKINVPVINGILQDAISCAKKQEGIDA